MGSGFAGVAGIAIGPEDVLYVADSGSGRIHKIDPTGETMVSQLMFVEPVDVDVGADGIVYVADKGASGIIWFDTDGFQTPAANAQHDAGSGHGLGDGGWAGDESGMHHDVDGGMYHGDMFMGSGDAWIYRCDDGPCCGERDATKRPLCPAVVQMTRLDF